MSDNDATITNQQLMMADMGGRIQLESSLRLALTELAKRDTSPVEKLNTSAQGSLQGAFPPETEISAAMLVKSNVAGDIDLDTSLRSTLSRVMRDSNPAKQGSMAKGQG